MYTCCTYLLVLICTAVGAPYFVDNDTVLPLLASLVFAEMIVWCIASHFCLVSSFSRRLRNNQVTELPEGLFNATTQLYTLWVIIEESLTNIQVLYIGNL